MAKIGDVGTLRELDVKPGDTVKDASGLEAKVVMYEGSLCVIYPHWDKPEDRNRYDGYRIVSRATPEPTIWRDMTPEEKGAMLLAAHEGRTVEYWSDKLDMWVLCGRIGNDEYAYRVKPEPKRETVTLYGGSKDYGYRVGYIPIKTGTETHRITFDTIDGVPDCDSVKMEAI